MKTFCIKTLGCKVNSYESEYIRNLFLNSGYIYDENNPLVYVINTCTVTNESDKKSRKIINSIKRNHKDSVVVAVGCFCQNKKEDIEKCIDADIILGNKDKSKVVDYVSEYLQNKKKIIKIYDMENQEFENMQISHFTDKARAFVKIEDGCNNFCSYCIIPYVRGRIRSRSLPLIVKEAQDLVLNGHKEIVLTGIHIGNYGKDINLRLYDLLVELLKIGGLKRIRLSSIEVVELDDDIISLIENNKVLASHLHIPLQSGCDKILKLMNRRYLTKDYEEIIDKIRKASPDISVTTDVIVGFPNETEEDFKETYNFCKNIKFSKIHVFPYSDRTGTVASKMENKVDQTTKKERVRKLINLSNELEREYYYSFIGKKENVIIETFVDGSYIGHTSNYLKLKLVGDYEIKNEYEVTIEEDMLVIE